MSLGDYTTRNRITLYEVPNLVTPGDIRRAIADKTEGVMNVQIDYKGFRPSGRAMLTMDNPEFLAKNLRALKSLHICGVKVRPVAHYSPDSRASDPEDPDKGVTGNGPEGNFPHVERNVVLWGMPGKTSVDDVALALRDFKVERKKEKTIIVKLEKCV
ncbi:hypothetical protein C0993_005562 [Termitomyces sp. T159_Od127]|nr:hypothetical protein C0993_005562 [Termitomyces sp. T159_Od127]